MIGRLDSRFKWYTVGHLQSDLLLGLIAVSLQILLVWRLLLPQVKGWNMNLHIIIAGVIISLVKYEGNLW